MNRAERRAQTKAERRVQVSPHWRRRLMKAYADARAKEQEQADASTHSESDLIAIGCHCSNSLLRLMSGEGIDVDVSTIDLAAKLSLEMALNGYGSEELLDFKIAAHSIEAIHYRGVLAGGKYTLKGAEVKALQRLIELQAEQLRLRPTAGEIRQFMTQIGIPKGSMLLNAWDVIKQDAHETALA